MIATYQLAYKLLLRVLWWSRLHRGENGRGGPADDAGAQELWENFQRVCSSVCEEVG